MFPIENGLSKEIHHLFYLCFRIHH